MNSESPRIMVWQVAGGVETTAKFNPSAFNIFSPPGGQLTTQPQFLATRSFVNRNAQNPAF